MLLLLELIIFVGVLAAWWYIRDQKRYSKHPPGPFRLPFVGNVVQVLALSKYPAVAFKKLAEKHGDVMFLKMGAGEAVVFSSRETVREMLNHDKAKDRTQFQFIRDRHANKNLGIIWGQGQPWQNLRRFTMRNLRDFGFGKSAEMDTVVNEEMESFVAFIREESRRSPNNIFHVEDLFNLTFINVLWRHVSGKSYDYNDPKMIRLLKLNNDFFGSTNMGLDITDVYPILRDWFPNWSGRTLQIQTSKDLFDYGKQLLDEHREQGGYQENPQCFIDAFAAKLEECSDDPETDFTDEQFVMTILDLLIAGSETSSKTSTFGILYMLLNPHVQQKVHKELDAVVPKDAKIVSSMKLRLPYTHATVLEILRYSTIAPVPAAREATDDFQFGKYFIRKGTSLIFNVQAVHFSDKLWGDPVNFRPERFLNSSGSVDPKKADLLESFGAGSRFCVGRVLAEVTVFLYFATMMKHFRYERVSGTNPSTDPLLGVTYAPRPFDVRIIERDNSNRV